MDTSIQQQTNKHVHPAWEAASWITADEHGTTKANPVCATHLLLYIVEPGTTWPDPFLAQAFAGI